MEESKYTIEERVFAKLLNDARDGMLLKQLLRDKRNRYVGIDYNEIESLCVMFCPDFEGGNA